MNQDVTITSLRKEIKLLRLCENMLKRNPRSRTKILKLLKQNKVDLRGGMKVFKWKWRKTEDDEEEETEEAAEVKRNTKLRDIMSKLESETKMDEEYESELDGIKANKSEDRIRKDPRFDVIDPIIDGITNQQVLEKFYRKLEKFLEKFYVTLPSPSLYYSGDGIISNISPPLTPGQTITYHDGKELTAFFESLLSKESPKPAQPLPTGWTNPTGVTHTVEFKGVHTLEHRQTITREKYNYYLSII